MAEEKNYFFPMIAIVAIVAIVGLVVLFMSKGTTAGYSTTPEAQYAAQISQDNNLAGDALRYGCVRVCEWIYGGTNRTNSTRYRQCWMECS